MLKFFNKIIFSVIHVFIYNRLPFEKGKMRDIKVHLYR